MTQIVFDIETCPAQDPAVLEEFRNNAAQNFKAPSTLTKEQAAIDLGITDKDAIKFTGKDSMIAQWSEKFKVEAAEYAAQEAWRKTALDGALGHICVIGMAINDYLPASFYRADWHAGEADVLREFFATVDEACAVNPNVQPVFIGHNLVNFDLRFIFQRAVVLGVKPSRHLPFNARPVGDRAAFDTMTAWAGFGNRVTLDKLARVLGAGGKGDMDGSMVWDAVRDGRIAEVADYCRADVEMTRAIYKRMTFTAPVKELADLTF